MDKQRSFLLDIFRIILCIGVVVYHYTPERPSSGPFMVNGFLVLSGFLVGKMFSTQTDFDVVRFYNNKARRLLPMFFAALLLGFACKIYTNSVVPAWKISEWANFSLVQYLMYYNTPLWYMGVEFFMLMLVPVLYCLSRTKWGLYLFVLVATLITCGLFSRVPSNSPFGSGLYFSPVARCWQFVLGVSAASLCAKMQKWSLECKTVFKIATYCLFTVFVVSGGILAIIKQAATLHYWNYSFSFDLLTSSFYAVLIPCLYSNTFDVLGVWKKMAKYASELTYPVFLIHVPVLMILNYMAGISFAQLPYWITAITAGIVSIVSAGIMIKLESRFLTVSTHKSL